MARRSEKPSFEILTAPEQSRNFRRLFDEGKAVRGERTIHSYSERVVSYATRDTVTALDSLQGLNIGLWHMYQGNKDLGKQILSGIDAYWNESAVAFKYLYPHSLGQEGITLLQQSLATYHGYEEAITNHTPTSYLGNSDFILQTETNVSYISEHGMPVASPIISIIGKRLFYLLENREAFIGARRRYEEVLGITGSPLVTDVTDAERLCIPERIMALVQSRRFSIFREIGNIYAEKRGGVSLEDIYGNEDVAAMGRAVLTYLSHIPQGNVFYQRMVACGFFTHAVVPREGLPNGLFKDPGYSEKLFAMQRWLADRLVLPVFDRSFRDTEFDALFKQSILHLDAASLSVLGLSLFISLSHGYDFIHAYNPDLNDTEIIASLPFAQKALALRQAQSPHLTGVILDEVTYELLRTEWHTIQSHLIERLGDTPQLRNLLAAFDILQKTSYTEIHSDVFLDTIRDLAGDTFLDRLRMRDSEVVQVIPALWKLPVSFKLHTGVSNEIVFSENSLPEILGFRKVTFVLNDVGGLLFFLTTKDQEMSIIGELDSLSGNISNLSLDLPPEHAYLVHLIHFILSATYHDLVIQRQLAAREIPKTPSGPKLRKVVEDPQPEPVEPTLRDLPREFIPRFKGGSSHGVVLESKILEEAANAERVRTGQRVYKFDSKPVYLPWAGRYKQAVEKYLVASDAERDALRAELIMVREKIYKITEDKRNSLPARFQLESLVDPVTGDVVSLQTWRVEFQIPKYTKGDTETLVSAYRRYFRGGSALSLLDQLTGWILE